MRKKLITIFTIFFLLLLPIVTADFKIWAERTGLFTIGKPERVNVYVQNLGTNPDSYQIRFSKSATYQTQDVSHLLNVNLESGIIPTLKQNEVGSTFATVTILGKIDSGTITFNATDSTGLEKSYSIYLTAGLPIALHEFSFIGILVILISSVFIYYSYKSKCFL